MSSNINPNNIDGTYPIAGQDNNSQGFRDNFTNTKLNFTYAATEITALQDNVILKGPLTVGGTVDNNMGGTLLYDATICLCVFGCKICHIVYINQWVSLRHLRCLWLS